MRLASIFWRNFYTSYLQFIFRKNIGKYTKISMSPLKFKIIGRFSGFRFEDFLELDYMSRNYISRKIIWVEIIWTKIIWVGIIWNVTEPKSDAKHIFVSVSHFPLRGDVGIIFKGNIFIFFYFSLHLILIKLVSTQ